jgi:hypothetical protein
MNIKKYHQYQEVDSVNCGPVCLKILFDSLGFTDSLESIISQLEFDKDGVFPPQLGLLLLKRSINNKIILANVSLISQEEIEDMSKVEIVDYLDRWLTENKGHTFEPFTKYLKKYVEFGGTLEVDTEYSPKKIEESIKEGSLFIVAVQQSLLWGQNKVKDTQIFDSIKGQANAFHFVIVNDMLDNNSFELIDPYPTGLEKHLDGIYSINGNTLFNAAMIALGVFIEISPYD